MCIPSATGDATAINTFSSQKPTAKAQSTLIYRYSYTSILYFCDRGELKRAHFSLCGYSSNLHHQWGRSPWTRWAAGRTRAPRLLRRASCTASGRPWCWRSPHPLSTGRLAQKYLVLEWGIPDRLHRSWSKCSCSVHTEVTERTNWKPSSRCHVIMQVYCKQDRAQVYSVWSLSIPHTIHTVTAVQIVLVALYNYL